MKFLFEFFPIILFFITYKIEGIYYATAVAIIASILQILYVAFYKKKKIEMTMWITLVLVVVFGGFTLILHDDMFIKWKPTILYWIFSLALIITKLFFKKNIIKVMLGKQISLPEKVWNNLNGAWAIFFAVLGFINLYVLYNFSTNAWVNFKLFGTLGLMILFVIIQTLYLAPHIDKDQLQKNKISKKK
jgi:intracellular septation protein